MTDGGSWKSGEVSLVHPLLTSCCAAQVLTGLELVLIPGPGVGNPWDKTLKQRFHPGWQRGWKASEDNEPRTLPPPAGCRNGVKCPGSGALSAASAWSWAILTHFHVLQKFWHVSSQKSWHAGILHLWSPIHLKGPCASGLLLEGNVPTYIFPEVPACSLSSSQISPASPWCQPAPLILSRVWCHSPLCRLCTHQNKQTETQTHPSRLIVRELASMLAQPDEFR